MLCAGCVLCRVVCLLCLLGVALQVYILRLPQKAAHQRTCVIVVFCPDPVFRTQKDKQKGKGADRHFPSSKLGIFITAEKPKFGCSCAKGWSLFHGFQVAGYCAQGKCELGMPHAPTLGHSRRSRLLSFALPPWKQHGRVSLGGRKGSKWNLRHANLLLILRLSLLDICRYVLWV